MKESELICAEHPRKFRLRREELGLGFVLQRFRTKCVVCVWGGGGMCVCVKV